jgi:hypothetical protein
MRYLMTIRGALFLLVIILLSAQVIYAQSELSPGERIAVVEKKIESGAARGELTKNEYSRLKPRLAVAKYKWAKIEKEGATEKSYRELEHYLYGLEKDTDRLLKNFRRK